MQYSECMEVVVQDVDHNVMETAPTLVSIGRKYRSADDVFFSATDGFT